MLFSHQTRIKHVNYIQGQFKGTNRRKIELGDRKCAKSSLTPTVWWVLTREDCHLHENNKLSHKNKEHGKRLFAFGVKPALQSIRDYFFQLKKGIKWFNLMKVAFIRDLFTIKHRFSYLIADIFHCVVLFLCQNAMSLYWWFSLLTFFLLKAHDRDTGENRKINFKVIKVEFVGSEGTVPQDLFLYTDSKAQEDPDGRFFADIRWDMNISDAFGRSPCRETTWSSWFVCKFLIKRVLLMVCSSQKQMDTDQRGKFMVEVEAFNPDGLNSTSVVEVRPLTLIAF